VPRLPQFEIDVLVKDLVGQADPSRQGGLGFWNGEQVQVICRIENGNKNGECPYLVKAIQKRLGIGDGTKVT
jgi:hypothetical protein